MPPTGRVVRRRIEVPAISLHEVDQRFLLRLPMRAENALRRDVAIRVYNRTALTGWVRRPCAERSRVSLSARMRCCRRVVNFRSRETLPRRRDWRPRMIPWPSGTLLRTGAAHWFVPPVAAADFFDSPSLFILADLHQFSFHLSRDILVLNGFLHLHFSKNVFGIFAL